jgi:hypothetical protein
MFVGDVSRDAFFEDEARTVTRYRRYRTVSPRSPIPIQTIPSVKLTDTRFSNNDRPPEATAGKYHQNRSAQHAHYTAPKVSRKSNCSRDAVVTNTQRLKHHKRSYTHAVGISNSWH